MNYYSTKLIIVKNFLKSYLPKITHTCDSIVVNSRLQAGCDVSWNLLNTFV